jgi:hypothetical protein
MKKADIIEAALKDLQSQKEKLTAEAVEVPAYKQQVTAELEKKLADVQPDLDVPTCKDFVHLGVKCCPVCHIEYPEWELALLEIESGGQAWMCCALDRALNPSKHVAMEQRPQWQKLKRMFFGDGESSHEE